MKINFFGTDIFASIILQGLVDNGFNIACVVTKPDDFVGRKKILTESKIATLAKSLNIPVEKPEKLSNFSEKLAEFNGDINVVCEYGKIIPESILYLPKFKSVNIHGSILPKYRGASPIQMALLNGDKETGVTLMKIDKEMDHGCIISIGKCNIEKDDIEPKLREKLANIGVKILIEELKYLEENGDFSNSIEQDHNLATFTSLINKQDGLINLSNTSEEVLNKFRAFIKWPGIFMFFNDKRVKITDIDFDVFEKIGEKNDKIFPFFIKDKQLFLICSDDKMVKINKLQFEGKNEITDKDFINQCK